MGNIEVRHTSKRKSIFEKRKDHRTISPRPLSQRFDTTKNRYDNHLHGKSDLVNTSRSIKGKKWERKREEERIDNFGDFMSKVKKQLHQHHWEQEQGSIYPRCSKKQLLVKMKLQNQRIQLEKYRKMVERELSKSHSIQQISFIEGQDQKSLLIQYDDLDLSKRSRSNTCDKNASIKTQVEAEKKKYTQMMTLAGRNYQKLQSKLQLMQKLLNVLQIKQQNVENKITENTVPINRSILQPKNNILNASTPSFERMNRISDMIENIDHLQIGQQCLDQQIRKTLANCMDSNSTSGFVSIAKDTRV